MFDEGWDANGAPVWEPYDVECARCGVVKPCDEMIVQEGDEWECELCNIRCDAYEYYEYKGIDIDLSADLSESAIFRHLSKG